MKRLKVKNPGTVIIAYLGLLFAFGMINVVLIDIYDLGYEMGLGTFIISLLGALMFIELEEKK